MSLKTEYTYNDDDFIQTTGGMKELTVTITLCEYRNLIQDIVRSEKTIDQLQDEKEKLKKALQTYINFVSIHHPEIKEKISEVANLLIKEPTTEPTTEKGGVQE